MDKRQRLKHFFDMMSKKPIFMCSPQTIKVDGKTYKGVPHCDYVQISWEDYNKLKELVEQL